MGIQLVDLCIVFVLKPTSSLMYMIYESEIHNVFACNQRNTCCIIIILLVLCSLFLQILLKYGYRMYSSDNLFDIILILLKDVQATKGFSPR